MVCKDTYMLLRSFALCCSAVQQLDIVDFPSVRFQTLLITTAVQSFSQYYGLQWTKKRGH